MKISEIQEKFGFTTCMKKRHILAIYGFFGFLMTYALRVNLSVAIVDMVHDSGDDIHHDQQLNDNSLNITDITVTRYQWSNVLQGYILASFFYGYIVTQLPAAFLTTKYGGKLFFGGGVGVCSLLAMLIPAATSFGPHYLIFLRSLQGLAQGFIYTSMHALWSKWAPPVERSRLATFGFSGSYIGTLVALSLGGIIGERLNWQSIFYISGGAGMLWTILWFFFISESPATHSTITKEEKEYIENSYMKSENPKSIPWADILQSKAVWGIVIAHTTENWGVYTMLTEMPKFLSETMNWKIEKAGILSALPYLIMAIVLYSTGIFSDCLMLKKKLTYTFIRKVFCCGGMIAQSIFMVSMIWTNNPVGIVISLMFAVGFGGMAWASFGVNHLDIGAGYANVLMGFSNTFATVPGIISPIITGHIVQEKSKEQWNIVFWISTVIYLAGALSYGLLGSGVTQPWAYSGTRSASSCSEASQDGQDYNLKEKEVNECNPLNNEIKKSTENKSNSSFTEGHVNTSYSTIEK